MNKNIFEQIEQMSESEMQALLGTEFPAELEKEASAEIDTSLLADALYSYGWLQAQRTLADVDGLDKVAAEDLQAHEQAEAEVAEQIEASLQALGTHMIEDPTELHKEAQAAAAMIFDGFSDCIEQCCMDKEAGVKMVEKAMKAAGKHLKKVKAGGEKMVHKGAMLGKKVGKKALHLAKKHGPAAGVGLAAGAAGTYAAMKKESGALTEEQILDLASDIALEKQATVNAISEGLNKLAAKGAHKGQKLHEIAKAYKKK